MSDTETDGYAGPAMLTVDRHAVPVHAVLDARHEPFGKLRATEPARVRFDEVGAGAAVALDAGAGAVTARLGDVDPWGRIRVAGWARPLPGESAFSAPVSPPS